MTERLNVESHRGVLPVGSPDSEGVDWYCGISFLEYYEIDKTLKKGKNSLYDEGWLELFDRVKKLRKKEDDIEIDDKDYDSEPFFNWNVFYVYREENDNDLVWPDFQKILDKDRSISETKEIPTLTVLLEIMRVNGMMPRTLKKKFLGQGTVEAKDHDDDILHNIYGSHLSFHPAYDTSNILDFGDYPDVLVLKNLLKTSKIKTENPEGGRGELFREVAKMIEKAAGIKITIDQTLKNQFLKLTLKDRDYTICELLNEIAEKLYAVWDWEGKNKIYFKPKEHKDLQPKLYCFDECN